MGFKCGVVGLPNVGKSTLFNAITRAGIPAQNYPFCTIEPHVGIVPVPDARLKALTQLVKPLQEVPTTVQIVDIAGIVKGASKGEGLGNKFLANIREMDAIVQVVRAFSAEKSDIIHVSGRVDPCSDIDDVNTELLLADLETLEKATLKAQKMSKSGQGLIEKAVLEKVTAAVAEGIAVRTLALSPEEKEAIRPFCLLTAKPILYIANVDEEPDADLLRAVQEKAITEGATVIDLCAATEAALAELDDADRKDMMDALGLTEPGAHRVIRAGYELLNLQTYFTAGEKEVRAWTIPTGATAPQAAGVIHTDFEKGFIRAEVIAFNDFIQYRGEQGAKEAGKLRLEGKTYVVNDGDVMHFRFNV